MWEISLLSAIRSSCFSQRKTLGQRHWETGWELLTNELHHSWQVLIGGPGVRHNPFLSSKRAEVCWHVLLWKGGSGKTNMYFGLSSFCPLPWAMARRSLSKGYQDDPWLISHPLCAKWTVGWTNCLAKRVNNILKVGPKLSLYGWMWYLVEIYIYLHTFQEINLW